MSLPEYADGWIIQPYKHRTGFEYCTLPGFADDDVAEGAVHICECGIVSVAVRRRYREPERTLVAWCRSTKRRLDILAHIQDPDAKPTIFEVTVADLGMPMAVMIRA